MLIRLSCGVFLQAALAAADVYNCSGTWTDRPCGSRAGEVQPLQEADPASVEKKNIVAALRRFAQKVQAEVGRTEFEADATADFCGKADVTVEECRARAVRADKALMVSLQTFSRIRQKSIELSQHQQELALRRERQLREMSRPKTARRLRP